MHAHGESNPHRHENSKDSEVTLGIQDILNKRENGQGVGGRQGVRFQK